MRSPSAGTAPTACATRPACSETTTVGAPVTNRDESFDATVRRLALFAQDEWSVTKQWSVYFGLRWEGIQIKSEGNSYAAIDNKSSVFSPLFQTLYKIPGSKNDQLRGGITRTYKAPNVAQPGAAPRHRLEQQPDHAGHHGQPAAQAGTGLGPGPGLRTLPAGRRPAERQHLCAPHRRHHALARVLHRRPVGAMPVNDGAANTRGIELEAKLPLRQMFPGWPALDLRANVSRSWSSLAWCRARTTAWTSRRRSERHLRLRLQVRQPAGHLRRQLQLPERRPGAHLAKPVRLCRREALAGPVRRVEIHAQGAAADVAGEHPAPGERERLQLRQRDGSRLTDTTITPTALQLRAMLETKF
jgi:hypothetical protein